jgi:hypothetical protein
MAIRFLTLGPSLTISAPTWKNSPRPKGEGEGPILVTTLQNPAGAIQNEASKVFPGPRMIKSLNFPACCRLKAFVGPV